ncbi:MAG: VOC family protein [Blastomonas fulva]|nr:VOC family protein [Blastomonas fulva]MDK2757465.1 VOC family protein [Blastomonas fulva]
MTRFAYPPAPWLLIPLCLEIAACSAGGPTAAGEDNSTKARMMGNPVVHFEIPVTDMDRAVAFYEAVFGYRLTRQEVDGYDMAFFARADGAAGASGALARGDVYRPSKEGVIVYFDVPDIDAVLQKAKARGARILYAKKDIGAAGFVAEIEDSEGNRIALSQVRD